MIERRPECLAEGPFDLVVVGGGIYGVMLSLESSRRGLRAALLEREDFGGATTWNSLRIVHGGLRYLQRLDLARHRESAAERAWLLDDFADLVQPLPCLMPLYGDGLRRPMVLQAALAVDGILTRRAARTGDGSPGGSREGLLAGRVLSPEETIARFPAVSQRGLAGAAWWFDAVVPDSHRLVVEALRWAAVGGAVVVNRCEARELLVEGGSARGVLARDLERRQDLEVRAPLVVNCAGPWVRELATRLDRDVPDLLHSSLAFNLLLDRSPPADCALAVAPGPGEPTYFLQPWKGMLLAGTVHVRCVPGDESGPPLPPRTSDVSAFLGDLERAVPGLEVGPENVLRVLWGRLPARRSGSTQLATRPRIVEHRALGGSAGLWSVSGVKLTTARAVAEETLRRAFAARDAPLPARIDLPRPQPACWPNRQELESLLERDPHRARELVERIRTEEAALHLDDLLLRRTDWGIDPRVACRLGPRIAALLDWPPPAASADERSP